MNPIRLRLEIAGAVQGVGFRPCVHQLAIGSELGGWVRNSPVGVEIEIEGEEDAVHAFPEMLAANLPPHSLIANSQQREIPVVGEREFHILESSGGDSSSAKPAQVLPDLATCSKCLAEVFEPSNRRFGYPFTNCTHCGPRFSIVYDLPYDRANTTMRDFEMCARCQEEYESPADRRFHAQPNACPDCGPHLSWLDKTGEALAMRDDALEHAARAIEDGKIVAVKGIGGFHLYADARNAEAIAELRRRKHRPAKPFALMAPSPEAVREQVEVSDDESAWLQSAAAPIVLLQRRADCGLPEILAPGNPTLGFMLPHSPLHHLLMRRLGFPVVATSGNRGDEPICIANDEAIRRLGGIADAFLTHDRPIARAVDDSVMRVTPLGEMVLRRSRGFAPAPIGVPGLERPVLAYGGDLKNTIAVAARDEVRISQHLGDLETVESRAAFGRHREDFPRLAGSTPEAIACDPHPAYHSRLAADSQDRKVIEVQHHYAHAVACAAENGIGPDEEYLAIVWDGTGYGADGTIWGGEFLTCSGAEFQRFAWLRPFRLPGGEKAVRDPRFAALGCLHEAGIALTGSPLDEALSEEEKRIGEALVEQKLNSPLTSSAGRLFDAVSALCGLCGTSEFEGQAAMALEHAASDNEDLRGYPIDEIRFAAGGAIDWTPPLRSIVDDLTGSSSEVATISLRFHLALAELIARCAEEAGRNIVALSGGCFQNALLLKLSAEKLAAVGHRPIWHRRVPPNDGGLAFGQAVVASRLLSSHTL